MRQYGSVPPILSTAQPPAVSSVTGLGTGGGAGVQSKGAPSDGQGFGYVELVTGSAPSAGGQVVLSFPQTPPTLFFAPNSDDLGALTITGQGTASVTVAWAGTPKANSRYRIAYEWSVSQ